MMLGPIGLLIGILTTLDVDDDISNSDWVRL